MRILAIDPGDKRIGVAISDPSGKIARPLTILKHISRLNSAITIAQLATDHNAIRIIVGQALDEDGKPSYQGRRAAKLAGAIRKQTNIPVVLWDESFTSLDAFNIQIHYGAHRKKQQRYIDAHAAAIILQTYLDSNI